MPKLHLYIHQPVALFKARVDMIDDTYDYPINEIIYDGVTLGAYTDIAFDALVTLGTTEGGDDLGRVRVNKQSDATKIYIPRTSQGIEDGQLEIENNAYITVWDDYRVWAKIPWFNLDNGIDYKDGDVEAGTYLTNIPPVANTGPGFADYIDSVTEVITVEFPGGGVDLSFAMADGATITGYAWDVKDGTITVGTATDAVITATFPAGFRWVELTVTDSNAVTHTARCPVLAVDPEADTTFKKYSISQNLEIGGQTLDIEIFDSLPRSTYQDGSLVMFWWDEPSAPDDRSHMKFVGWLDSESSSVGRKKQGLTKSTKLKAVDVAGRLKLLPGFPQAIERVESDSPWSYMPGLDMNKGLHYLIQWHSTALNIADFFLPADGDDYNTMRLDTGASSLYDQIHSTAMKLVPDHWLTCNSKGQLSVTRDWMLDDAIDRPVVAHTITEDEWNDLQIEYSRQPKVHVLRSGAIVAHTAFITVDGEDTVPLAFSIAPSNAEAFGQGVTEATENEGITLTQDDLNDCEGHRYARLNSRFGPFNFIDPTGTEFWNYEPAEMGRIQLNVGASYAAQRGLSFTQAIGQVKTLQVNYNTTKQGTVIKTSVTFEKEVVGHAAITYEPEGVEEVGYVPAVEPAFSPGLQTGVEQVALLADGGQLFVTSDFQSSPPTWAEVTFTVIGTPHASEPTPELLYSWVVDPFSPGYRGTPSGAINGWAIDKYQIWRLEDLFGATPTAEAVFIFTDPPAAYGVRPEIAASFGMFQETEADNPWIVAVRHIDVNDSTTTYDKAQAVYSVDGGQTWSSEITITTHADNRTGLDVGRSSEFWPMLWLSPRTPGLAYTSFFDATGVNASTYGYVTDDWGATWSKVVTPALDTNQYFGGTIHVPWFNNADESIIYYGHQVRGTPHVYSLKRFTGETLDDISPTVGGSTYGPFRGKFGIQTFDTNRNYLLFCGTAGKNTGTTPYRAYSFFTSNDAGETWSTRLGPLDSLADGTDYFLGWGGWEAAFSADDPNIIYLWGGTPAYDWGAGSHDPWTWSPGSYLIAYSEDFGATFENKEGNLTTIYDNGSGGFQSIIGIAGGATS